MANIDETDTRGPICAPDELTRREIYNRPVERFPSNVSRSKLIESILCEGEQFANALFDTGSAKDLDEFGVDYIELTTPVASPQLGLKAKVLAHVRCHMDDVRVAVESDVDGVSIMMGTSALLRQHSHGKDVAQIIKAAVEVIEYVKSQGLEVRCSTEDSFRSNLADILSVYKTVDSIRVNRVGVADTIGCANPRQVHDLIHTLRGVDNVINKPNVSDVSFSNRLAISKPIKLHLIRELEDMVAEAVQINTPFNNPITGFCVFTHRSGTYARGVSSHPSNYEIINPEDFGITRYVHFESRLAGWHAVKTRVSQPGLDMPDDQVRVVTEKIDILAGIRPLAIEDVDSIIRSCFHAGQSHDE
ncbi:HMGL-like-domain-containing protein [Colletotrichum caudatum]|nr:HMGL-like-domain-containing protein [Colletotrichum caudatum]